MHSHLENRGQVISAEEEGDHQYPDVCPPHVMMLQKSPQDQQTTQEVREKEEREQKYLKLVSFKPGQVWFRWLERTKKTR